MHDLHVHVHDVGINDAALIKKGIYDYVVIIFWKLKINSGSFCQVNNQNMFFQPIICDLIEECNLLRCNFYFVYVFGVKDDDNYDNDKLAYMSSVVNLFHSAR